MVKRFLAILALAVVFVCSFVLANIGSAKPPDFCIRHPNHPQCQTTSSTPTTTTPTPPGTLNVPCGANIASYQGLAAVLQLGDCSYPDQNFTGRVPVTIQGQLGTTIGDISTHGASGIVFKNLRAREAFLAPQNGSSGGVNSSDITFDTVDFYAGGIFTRGCVNCAFVNGSSGNRCDAYSQTIGGYSSSAPSMNIVIKNWTSHDITRRCNTSGHVECLFIQESVGVILDGDTFHNCEVFDLYVSDLFGGPISGISVRNTRFDSTVFSGFYAVEINFNTNVEFLRNSFDQGLYVQRGSVTGCGNTVSSGFLFPAVLLQPC
jgi:hypothetical protein